MNIDTLKSLLWWLLIGGLFFWMMRRGGCGMMMGGGHGRRTSEDEAPPRFRSASGRPIDPVCGMEVDPGKAVGTRLVMGETFFFCSPMCLETFDKRTRRPTRTHLATRGRIATSTQVAEKEGEPMKSRLDGKVLGAAMGSFLALTYLVCVTHDLVFHETMYRSWMGLLPGFVWLHGAASSSVSSKPRSSASSSGLCSHRSTTSFSSRSGDTRHERGDPRRREWAMDWVKAAYRPAARHAAHRALVGRVRDRNAPDRGRFTRADATRMLAAAWRRYDEASAKLAPQPTLGSTMNVRLACFTFSSFEEL